MAKCKNPCPQNKFNGCCTDCKEEQCGDRCTFKPDDCGLSIQEGEDMVTVFRNEADVIIKRITDIVMQKKQLEEAEKEMRSQLQKAMEQFDVKKFSNEHITLTYVAATTRNSIDSTRLKKDLPDIAMKYTKTSDVSASVKIEVK